MEKKVYRELMSGYNGTYTERALAHLEKDICYLARNNYGYGMTMEDVAQELRFQIFRKINQYDPRKKALRTWAQTVMRRRLMDMARDHGRKIESKPMVSYEIWVVEFEDYDMEEGMA